MNNPTQALQVSVQTSTRHQIRPKRFAMIVVALVLVLMTAAACIPNRVGVSWAGLTTIGERQNILVVYNDLIALVDPSTGQETPLLNDEGEQRRDENGNIRRWRVADLPQGSQFFGVPLQLDERTLLIADYAHKYLSTIDVPTARIEPTTDPIGGQPVANLTTDGTRIFIPYYNQGIAAYDVETRELDWLLETTNGIWSQPLLHEGVLYFGAMDHQLYAANAETGEKLWEIDLNGAIAGSPVVYNNRLYVGSFDRKVFEVTLTGEITHTYATENWIWGTPVIQGDMLYAADMAGYVYALRLGVDGGFTEVWKTKSPGSGIRPSPLVTENYVIVASRDGFISWLDIADGSVKIQREVQTEVLSDILLIQPSDTLTIAESLVVISTQDRSRTLIAFTLSQGDQFWVYSH